MSSQKKGSGSKGTSAAKRSIPKQAAATPADVAPAADADTALVEETVVEDAAGHEGVEAIQEAGTEDQPDDAQGMAVDSGTGAAAEDVATVEPDPAPMDARAVRARASAAVRDPRLPLVGTPITRKWRGRTVTAIEQEDGTFIVDIEGTEIGRTHSVSKAAQVALLTAGLKSPVNGYAWFGLIEKEHTPHKRSTAARLATLVAKLQVKLDRAMQRAAKIKAVLESARSDLLAATAAETASPEPPAAE